MIGAVRRTHPLPSELQTAPFTRAQALSRGVSAERLRRSDIERLSRGIYRWRGAGGDHAVGSSEVDEPLLRALTRRSEGIWFSHVTAARLWGAPLPSRLLRDSRLHLSGPNRSHDLPAAPAWTETVQHFPQIRPGEAMMNRGIRVSSPHRVFIDLMGMMNVPDLVILGDWLVRQPHGDLEGREEPYSSIAQLISTVQAHRWTAGIVRGREALEQIRVGADSPPETLLRLALADAGLPEPQLQIPCVPGRLGTAEGDMGYREARIVIQYEGEHHFTAEQQARDQRRNAEFEAEGWTVVLANRVDLAQGFTEVSRRVRMLLSLRSVGAQLSF